jgi:endoglucanase
MSLVHRLIVVATLSTAAATSCLTQSQPSAHSGHDPANPGPLLPPSEPPPNSADAGESRSTFETSAPHVAQTTSVSQPVSSTSPGDGSWWSIPYPETFDKQTLARALPRIAVKGNAFVDEAGLEVTFQGVNVADPDKLSREGHWNKSHFETIASWGENVVRIPIHPAAWRDRGKGAYLALLDQAVVWATDLELHLIFDWHSIGNLRTGMFQHPMYETSTTETFEFWRAVAHRYAGVPTVAFYELFNEPTVYNGTLGTLTWEGWKELVEEMVDIIQAHDKQVIPLVAGFNWAYDLRDAGKQPVNRKGITYVSHPYPQKTSAPYERNWDRDFGALARRYPLFATEIGYMTPNAPGSHIPVKDEGVYGPRITDYLAKKGASWTAWCFQPDWPPQLIADWNYTPTAAGTHFKTVMLEAKSKRDAARKEASP